MVDQSKLKAILRQHKLWLDGDGGIQADLSWADLRFADLSDSNLRYADFREANLHGATFRGSDLSFADLRGADLSDADLHGAGFIEIRTDIWTAQIHKTTVRIGCKHHTHDEWMKFTDNEIAAMGIRALKWWKTWKPAIEVAIKAVNEQNEGVDDE